MRLLSLKSSIKGNHRTGHPDARIAFRPQEHRDRLLHILARKGWPASDMVQRLNRPCLHDALSRKYSVRYQDSSLRPELQIVNVVQTFLFWDEFNDAPFGLFFEDVELERYAH